MDIYIDFLSIDFVLSRTISVVSDNILRVCIQEPLLILKKFSFSYFINI